MHWLGYNDAVSWLNEVKTRIFQPPEILHDKGNGGGFTKMLFQRRFTHYTMAIPFILLSPSLFFFIPLPRYETHLEGDDSLLRLLLITSHK